MTYLIFQKGKKQPVICHSPIIYKYTHLEKVSVSVNVYGKILSLYYKSVNGVTSQ